MVERDSHGRVMKGSVLNPNGRPPVSNSWAGIIRELTNMTTEQLLEAVGGPRTELGKQIKKYPKGVIVKRLLAARLITALMFDPTPGLVNALMDREEGKVPDKLDMTVRPTLKIDD